MVRRILEIDLIRANAKASDDYEILSFTEDSGSELCLRADANDVHVSVVGTSTLAI